MSTTIKVKGKKVRFYTIKLPEIFEDIDIDKLALNTYPYKPIKDRLLEVFTSIYIASEKQSSSSANAVIFEGSPSEIQMEIWENGKHILLARGMKFFCPCLIGKECIKF